MNINDLIPGLAEFKASLDKQPIKGPDGFEHEREAWQLGDYIPSTYLEGGIRHIVVFDLDEPIRYTYDPTEGLKQVRQVF